MATYTVNDSQRKAALAAGIAYLATDALAVFAEFYARGSLIVYGDAAKTVANIMAHETLFRIAIATQLATIAGVAALVAALYVVLKPVSPGLAVLAAVWRLIENCVIAVMTISSFQILHMLSRTAFLRAFEADRVQELTMLYIGTHDDAYNIALMFFGLGSAIFGYVWLKSRYIPRALAGLGIFSSLVVAACTLAFVIAPKLANTLAPACYMPILIFEIAIGILLVVKGLRPAEIADRDQVVR